MASLSKAGMESPAQVVADYIAHMERQLFQRGTDPIYFCLRYGAPDDFD